MALSREREKRQRTPAGKLVESVLASAPEPDGSLALINKRDVPFGIAILFFLVYVAIKLFEGKFEPWREPESFDIFRKTRLWTKEVRTGFAKPVLPNSDIIYCQRYYSFFFRAWLIPSIKSFLRRLIRHLIFYSWKVGDFFKNSTETQEGCF